MCGYLNLYVNLCAKTVKNRKVPTQYSDTDSVISFMLMYKADVSHILLLQNNTHTITSYTHLGTLETMNFGT